MKTARVVIADDHALAREGLRVMLDRSGRFDVVGEAASGEEALALCEQHRPDLALLDIRYGTRGGEAGIDGLEAARLLSDTQPEIAIIILTMHDNADYLRAAIAAGARGFITKDASRDELLAAIDLVAAGGVAYPPSLMRRAVVATGRSPVFAALERLTPREREVLDALASGGTNKEIALALGITPGTVKTHVERVIGKLGVRDRTQAAVIAVEHRSGWTA
jgi:two-component system NarL family response regulator